MGIKFYKETYNEIQQNYTAKTGYRVLVRNATAHDAYAVTNLSNQNYLDCPFLSRGAEDPGDNTEGTLSYIEDLLDAERKAFLVAEIDNQVVGFGHLDSCGIRKKMLHRCEIDMSIKKDFRNHGVGHCLMDTLISLAKDADYEQIELNVIEDNTLGVSLYKSHGFEVTGRNPHAYKYPDGNYGDYLFMVRYL